MLVAAGARLDLMNSKGVTAADLALLGGEEGGVGGQCCLGGFW